VPGLLSEREIFTILLDADPEIPLLYRQAALALL
jgi:hypothetical protein